MDNTNRDGGSTDCMNCLHLGWDRGLLLCVSRVPEEKLAVHNLFAIFARDAVNLDAHKN